jgi:hypothetical protein
MLDELSKAAESAPVPTAIRSSWGSTEAETPSPWGLAYRPYCSHLTEHAPI